MPRSRLIVDISPDLRRRVRIAAAARDMPVNRFVEGALTEAVTAAEGDVPSAQLRGLSSEAAGAPARLQGDAFWGRRPRGKSADVLDEVRRVHLAELEL